MEVCPGSCDECGVPGLEPRHSANVIQFRQKSSPVVQANADQLLLPEELSAVIVVIGLLLGGLHVAHHSAGLVSLVNPVFCKSFRIILSEIW